MSRPLVAGLVAEGEADEGFLGIVISRQLRELAWMSPHAVDVEATEVVSCDREHMVTALEELAADCHLLFTHDDRRDRGKAGGKADGVRYHSHYLVPVIGLGETEAWMLADPAVWAGWRAATSAGCPSAPRRREDRGPGRTPGRDRPPPGQADPRLLRIHRTQHRSRRPGPGARVRGLGRRDEERMKGLGYL